MAVSSGEVFPAAIVPTVVGGDVLTIKSIADTCQNFGIPFLLAFYWSGEEEGGLAFISNL